MCGCLLLRYRTKWILVVGFSLHDMCLYDNMMVYNTDFQDALAFSFEKARQRTRVS